MSIKNEYKSSVTFDGLPTPSQVIEACDQNGFFKKGFTVYRHNGIPTAFIKYGHHERVREGEPQTQLYVSKAFKHLDAPLAKIPEVYLSFDREDEKLGTVRYLVMEYVPGQTLEAAMENCSPQFRDGMFDRVARIVDQLLNIPLPNPPRLGPVERGTIHHGVFREDGAAIEYKSIGHLERHINKILSRTVSKKRVDFSEDVLCFCYHDIAGRNFMLTPDNDIYVVDFGHAAFVPDSLLSYTFYACHGFRKEISDRLSVPRSKNLYALNYLDYWFMITGGATHQGLPCD